MYPLSLELSETSEGRARTHARTQTYIGRISIDRICTSAFLRACYKKARYVALCGNIAARFRSRSIRGACTVSLNIELSRARTRARKYVRAFQHLRKSENSPTDEQQSTILQRLELHSSPPYSVRACALVRRKMWSRVCARNRLSIARKFTVQRRSIPRPIQKSFLTGRNVLARARFPLRCFMNDTANT